MTEKDVEIVQVNGDNKIKFFCPICEQKLRVGLDMAGKKITCAGCSTVVDIPKAPHGLLRRLFKH